MEALIVAIVAGLLVAWFTSRLAGTRHRSDTIWSRKVDCYSAVLEAFFDLDREYDAYFDVEFLHRLEDPNTEPPPLPSRVYALQDELFRTVRRNELALSEDVMRVFTKLESDLTDYRSGEFVVIDRRNAVIDAKGKLVSLAKRELGSTAMKRWERSA